MEVSLKVVVSEASEKSITVDEVKKLKYKEPKVVVSRICDFKKERKFKDFKGNIPDHDVTAKKKKDAQLSICLEGPVSFFIEGKEVIVRINIWLPKAFPSTRPLVYVVSQHKTHCQYVDLNGLLIDVPEIDQWKKKTSTLTGIVSALETRFKMSSPIHLSDQMSDVRNTLGNTPDTCSALLPYERNPQRAGTLVQKDRSFKMTCSQQALQQDPTGRSPSPLIGFEGLERLVVTDGDNRFQSQETLVTDTVPSNQQHQPMEDSPSTRTNKTDHAMPFAHTARNNSMHVTMPQPYCSLPQRPHPIPEPIQHSTVERCPYPVQPFVPMPEPHSRPLYPVSPSVYPPNTLPYPVFGNESNTSSGRVKDSQQVAPKPLKPSKLTFYERTEKSKCYEVVNNRGRGKALIINVKQIKGFQPRTGTDMDRDNLKRLWQSLNFDVTIYNDYDGLTKRGILDKIYVFATEGRNIHVLPSCIVVCFLSHGDKDGIRGTDGEKVPYDKMLQYFDNDQSDHLQGVPKQFYIQACRGDKHDQGAIQTDSTPETSTSTEIRIPSMTDYLVGWPTHTGYVAHRHRDEGSWYITGLVEVFTEHAHNEDVGSMMAMVNNWILEKVKKENVDRPEPAVQMSNFTSALTKKLFFFPGIARHS